MTGTRWVEHRAAALDSHLDNLPILIGFLDLQIQLPHNATIKKLVSKMKGIRQNIAKTKCHFQQPKTWHFNLAKTTEQNLQETNLLLLEFLTTCQMTVQNISRMRTLLNDERENVLDNKELFPQTEKLLSILKAEPASYSMKMNTIRYKR